MNKLKILLIFWLVPLIGISSSHKIDSIKHEIETAKNPHVASDMFVLYSALTAEYEVEGDTFNYVNSLIKLADLSRAAESHHIALMILKDLMNSGITIEPEQKIQVCLVRGSIYVEIYKNEEAIYWAKQGLVLTHKFEIYRYEALLKNLLGASYTPINQDSGLKYLQQSVDAFLAKKDTAGAILPQIKTSEMYYLQGKHKEGVRLMNQALAYLDKQDEPIYRQMAYGTLAAHHKKLQNYKQSTLYLSLRDSLIKKINNNKIKFQISQFQQKFEKQEDEQKRMALEAEIEIAQMQNQKNQIISIIGVLVIIGLGIGLFVLFSINKKRKQITRTLAKKANELETVNKFKNQVLAVISHDMRSPLAQVITFQHAKNSGINFSPEELREMDKTIMASAKNGLLILDNLLKWANNQFNGEDLTLEKFDSKFVLNQVINQVSEISKEKEIEIYADIADVEIFTNESLFQIIIRNLLNNAIKFSPLHSEIRISSKVVNQHLEVIVHDQGPGIPDAIIESLSKGKQIKPKLGSFGEKGAGIGLSFSKEFAERIGASFEFTPDMLVGTEVVFRVPIGIVY